MRRIHSIFKQTALATALAVVTLATPAAFAQGQHRGNDRDHYDDRNHDHRNDRGDYRDDRRNYRDDRRDHRDYRKDARKAYRQDHYRQDQKNYRRWARGQYIPRDYMGDRYYVNYRTYRLAPPPRGYAWVRPYQNDDTYYMVQIASGLIAQIFNNR